MRGFDLEQLRTFVAVADSGSLSAAAPRLFLSQSSVSEQLRKLEERAGVPLLLRGRRGVQPTPAGERLLGHARRMLDLDALAMQDIRGETLAGELRLAITDYYRTAEIAGMLRRLRERHPQLRLHVTVMKSAAIDASADDDAFDIGLTMRVAGARGGTGERPRAGLRPLRREPLAWVAARGETAQIGMPLPLVLLPDTCSLHQYVVRMLKRARVPYRVSHSASGVAGLQMALAAGLGISCLNQSAIPAGVATLDAATVSSLRLPALPDVEFCLLPPRRGEAPVVQAAREVLAEQLG
ncbi:LysR family transcriptional regulator [Cupriavidus sp. UGS-1]|uniref:LysR family transcriptional regulator n=1 Tax=Cupriavidus sp. UGS-1 TaxID=2899826 RepID=UPI001E63E841|nr:LysR family transcriptional regulator [Cupriavidus sp. UGS-1]MCD9123540.1 LysR family transcriptional regulator [Cupriavidus sp. UGS-1]